MYIHAAPRCGIRVDEKIQGESKTESSGNAEQEGTQGGGDASEKTRVTRRDYKRLSTKLGDQVWAVV